MYSRNNRPTSEAYRYIPINNDVFVYIGKDKTKWHKLEAVIANDFREKKIAY